MKSMFKIIFKPIHRINNIILYILMSLYLFVGYNHIKYNNKGKNNKNNNEIIYISILFF